jgi:hypothetical protein
MAFAGPSGDLCHKYNNQAFPVKYTNLNVLQLVCPAFRLKYSNYTPYIGFFSVYTAYSGFAAESATRACETMFGVPAGTQGETDDIC